VEDADAALDESLARTQEAAKKAGEQYKRGRMGFCRTCLIILVVGLLFTAMLVYIRLTALVGLKGNSGVW